MSTCIGEKNKSLFIGYLLVQSLQTLIAIINLLSVLINQQYVGMQSSTGMIALIVILGIFTIMMLTLFGFQFYFCWINITTWEFMRWDKIEYLQIFDRKVTSPFNLGGVNNIALTFRNGCSKKSKNW